MVLLAGCKSFDQKPQKYDKVIKVVVVVEEPPKNKLFKLLDAILKLIPI